MLCLTCGRKFEALTAHTGSRGCECLDCSDNSRQWPSVEPARASTAQELPAAAQTSDDFALKLVDDRPSGPNAWVRSLERAQQRCAALAEAAARDRAARAAQSKRTAAVRRDVEPPIQVPVPVSSPTPKAARPEEANRFDSLWDNLASGIPSSLGVTSLTEEPAEQETLAPSESEAASALARQIQIPEPTHEPAAPSLSPSTTEQIAESEVVVPPESTSSLATKVESAEPQQEPTPALLVSPPSIEETAQINDLKPVPPPELALELPTGGQPNDEDPQASVQASTTEAGEPAPDDASPLLPPKTPRSSMLLAMVGLLRTGLRGLEGHGRDIERHRVRAMGITAHRRHGS